MKQKKHLTRGGITPKLLLDYYDAWLRSNDPNIVAAALGTVRQVIHDWPAKHPELAMAKKLAEERRGDRSTFQGYIFKRLSKEAQKVWEDISFWSEQSAYEKIEQIFSGHTKKLRQELFVHALVSSNFDMSTALHMVGLPYQTVKSWKDTDLAFTQLLEEITWHKKNFFETALLDLVEARHPSAVIFVNETINKDRGYSRKIEVEHSGAIDTGGINLADLDLDIQTRQKILEAIRRKKQDKERLTQESITLELTNGN